MHKITQENVVLYQGGGGTLIALEETHSYAVP